MTYVYRRVGDQPGYSMTVGHETSLSVMMNQPLRR